MFEVFESIPAYTGETANHITRKAYDEAVNAFTKHLKRAIELFEAYWRTGNATLFDMSLEKLLQAHLFMVALADEITDERLLEKLRNRATFIYDLAACMLGAMSLEKLRRIQREV